MQRCWTYNRVRLAQIMEYHDATRHRHSAVVGQGLGCHLLKPAPKKAMGSIVFNESAEVGQTKGVVPHDEEDTLQSITTG
jgi:hypothetical protein